VGIELSRGIRREWRLAVNRRAHRLGAVGAFGALQPGAIKRCGEHLRQLAATVVYSFKPVGQPRPTKNPANSSVTRSIVLRE